MNPPDLSPLYQAVADAEAECQRRQAMNIADKSPADRVRLRYEYQNAQANLQHCTEALEKALSDAKRCSTPDSN